MCSNNNTKANHNDPDDLRGSESFFENCCCYYKCENIGCTLDGINIAQLAFVENIYPKDGSKAIHHEASNYVRRQKKAQELTEALDIFATCPRLPKNLTCHHEHGIKDRQ